jgi:hypothetical protein
VKNELSALKTLANDATGASASMIALLTERGDSLFQILDQTTQVAVEMIAQGRPEDAAALLVAVRRRIHGIPKDAHLN